MATYGASAAVGAMDGYLRTSDGWCGEPREPRRRARHDGHPGPTPPPAGSVPVRSGPRSPLAGGEGEVGVRDRPHHLVAEPMAGVAVLAVGRAVVGRDDREARTAAAHRPEQPAD